MDRGTIYWGVHLLCLWDTGTPTERLSQPSFNCTQSRILGCRYFPILTCLRISMLRTVSAINTEKNTKCTQVWCAPPPPPPDCCSTYVTYCYHLCSLPATQHCYGVNMHFVSVAPLSQCSAHFAGNHDGYAGAATVAGVIVWLHSPTCFLVVMLQSHFHPSPYHLATSACCAYFLILFFCCVRFFLFCCNVSTSGSWKRNQHVSDAFREVSYKIILGMAILCVMYTAFCLSMLQKHKEWENSCMGMVRVPGNLSAILPWNSVKLVNFIAENIKNLIGNPLIFSLLSSFLGLPAAIKSIDLKNFGAVFHLFIFQLP